MLWMKIAAIPRYPHYSSKITKFNKYIEELWCKLYFTRCYCLYLHLAVFFFFTVADPTITIINTNKVFVKNGQVQDHLYAMQFLSYIITIIKLIITFNFTEPTYIRPKSQCHLQPKVDGIHFNKMGFQKLHEMLKICISETK